MARRVPDSTTDIPTEPGGASGVPGPIEGAITKVTMPGESAPSKAILGAPLDVKVKHYETESCGKEGKWVMYAGQRILFRDGKRVTDNAYDIGLLERQGVKLKLLGEF